MAPNKSESPISLLEKDVQEALNQKVPNEETIKDHKEKTVNENLSIDRGWAWVVAFACMANAAILIGYLMCNGILFVEFLKLFKASTTSTTLIFCFSSAIFSISSFIVMQILLPRFSMRQIMCTGGFLVSVGVLTSMFAQNIAMLIASQSIFVGIGQSMIMGVNIVAPSRYFKKKRAFALSITSCGISLAALIFPSLCRFLLDTYGLRGTLLLLSGIELNIIVASSLVRPLKLPEDEPSSSTIEVPVTDAESKDLTAELLPRQISSTSEKHHKNHVHLMIEDEHMCESNGNLSVGRMELHNHEREGQENIRPRLLTMTSFVGSVASIPASFVEEAKPRTKTGIIHDIKGVFKSLDFSLWKRPSFILILITSTFGIPIYIYNVYLPAILEEFKSDPADVPIFLMLIGSVDFVSRLAIGYFADLKYVKMRNIMAIAISIAGINCHLMRFYQSYTSQFICVTIFGIFSNIYSTLLSVYVTDLLGLHNLPKAISFLNIVHGAMISTIHPVVGILKDTTGTFISSYHFLGTLALISAITLLCEPLAKKLEKKKSKHIESTQDTGEE